MNNCITSVAFREPYVTHSRRQRKIIGNQPNSYYLGPISFEYFENELPHSDGTYTHLLVERFQESLYGFKPHAIRQALSKGYTKIIWFDPSVLPTVSVDVLFDALDTHPMIVRTGDQPINPMVNDKAVKWFGLTREELKDVKHVGGTVYGFNFNDPKTVECFNLWKRAEEEGIFGTQDDFMAGHWADEACMALAMYKCGMPQYWEEKFTYLNQKEL